MFVFSSVCTAALWFAVRWVHDLVLPGWRHDPARANRRFWQITTTAAVLATAAAFIVFRLAFSPFAGWYAAAVMAPLYVGLCVAWRALLRAFQEQ